MHTDTSGTVIRPWQAALLALALATLVLTVLAPALTLSWACLSVVVAATALIPFAELVGGDRFLLGGALHLAGAIVIVPLLLASLRVALRQILAGRGVSPEPAPWWRGRLVWILAAVGVINLLLLPAHLWFGVPIPKALLGAGLLTGAAGISLALLAGALWLGTATTRTAWRFARRSPMATGVLVAAAVFVPALGYTHFVVLDALGRALANPAGAQVSRACERPALSGTCDRWLGTRATTTALAETSAPPAQPEDHRAMAECIEALHQSDPGRRYALSDMVDRAERLLNNRDDARDVVQQTLLAVCLRHEQQQIADLHAYFAQSVVNRARSARRRRWCSIPVDEESPLQCPAPSPEELAVHEERVRAVEGAYCDLELNDAMVIELRDFEALEYAEIARRLGCSTDAARQRHSRALREFGDRFRQRCW